VTVRRTGAYRHKRPARMNNFLESAKQRVKREFLWILRFDSSSKMTNDSHVRHTYLYMKRNKHGMLFA